MNETFFLTENDLARWPSSVHQNISTALQHIDEFFGTLRTFSPSGYPMAPPHPPFCDLTDAALLSAIANSIRYPEKVGRLSSSIRSHFGIQPPQQETARVVEAHIDATSAPIAVMNELVALGFEPDDFRQLEPPCYKKHFTLAFHVADAARKRGMQLEEIVRDGARRAAHILQGATGVDAFIECESYRSKWIRKYADFARFRAETLVDFPYSPGHFCSLPLPRTNSEAAQLDIPLYSRKQADIHVKLPTEARAREYPFAATPDALELRRRLQAIGFYEIVSEAGNAIYTGQFLFMRPALAVFRKLDRFFSQHGGASSLCVEACTDFWRKETTGSQQSTVLALVSPVLTEASGL